MLGETLLVGCIRLKRNIFGFVHIVLAQYINLVLIAIFYWSWFDERGIVATLEYFGVIFFLRDFGRGEILTLGDRVSFEGGLVGGLGLQLELGFVGVVGVGAPAVILSHIETIKCVLYLILTSHVHSLHICH